MTIITFVSQTRRSRKKHSRSSISSRIETKKKKKQTILISALVGSIVIGTVSLGIIIAARKETSLTQKGDKLPKPSSEKIETPEGSEIPSTKNPPSLEENNNCPYLKEYVLTVSAKVPQDFIIKLWKKGYHWSDIRKFWDWQLDEKDIPDRTATNRIGVIKSLGVLEKLSSPSTQLPDGTCSDLVIVLSCFPAGGSKINIDGCIMEKINGTETQRSSSTRKYVEKLINFVLNQEKIDPQHYQISLSLPRGAENTGRELETGHNNVGKSFGSAIYLALLSALHKKPISKQVATTGYVSTKSKKGNMNGRQVDLPSGTNLPIGGLEAKIPAAVANGVNCLVLSKYNSAPHLLSLNSKRDPFFLYLANFLGLEKTIGK